MLQGKKIATLNVGFATNATVYDTAPTQSDISSKVTGTGNSTSSSSTSCSAECAIYNLTCAIKHKCWSRIGLFFGYIGIAIVVGESSSLCMPSQRSFFDLQKIGNSRIGNSLYLLFSFKGFFLIFCFFIYKNIFFYKHDI